MVDNAPPSGNPADQGSLVGVFRTILKKTLQNTHDMLPATVLAFDRTTNMAEVQPLIMMVDSEGKKIARAKVASVPVFQIGAGNFMLNFPINAGDIGFIKANDRDISLFMQSGNMSGPGTDRLHSFEDGVFFPAVLRDFIINDEDQENVVLSTVDGTQRVTIWPDRVKVTSDNEITLDAPLVRVTGDFICENDGVDGTATFNGTIRTVGDVVADFGDRDVSLNGHVHINGGGTGDSGIPKAT